MSTCKVIIEGTIGEQGVDTPEFKEYLKRAIANDKAHGGVEIHNYRVTENLGQGGKPDFIVILEYPSYEAAKNAFTSEEYTAILPLRENALKEVKILITK